MHAPTSVKTGVSLMWASLVVSVITAIYLLITNQAALTADRDGVTISMAVLIVGLVVFVALCAFFIAMVAKGKNWARLVCLIVFILSALSLIYHLPGQFRTSMISSILHIVTHLLFLLSLIFVFKKDAKFYFTH